MPIGAGAAAGITAASSLIGTGANIGFAAGSTKRQREWQEKMWNLANQWNLPVNQVQRMRDAGLNPRLMYGTGSAGGGTTSQSPTYQKPNIQMGLPDMLGIIQQMQDIKLTEANRKKVDSETLTDAIQRSLVSMNIQLTNQQSVDLQNRINAMEATAKDGKTFYQQDVIQRYQKGARDIESKGYQVAIEKVISEWATANNLNKIVAPFVLQMLRGVQ